MSNDSPDRTDHDVARTSTETSRGPEKSACDSQTKDTRAEPRPTFVIGTLWALVALCVVIFLAMTCSGTGARLQQAVPAAFRMLPIMLWAGAAAISFALSVYLLLSYHAGTSPKTLEPLRDGVVRFVMSTLIAAFAGLLYDHIQEENKDDERRREVFRRTAESLAEFRTALVQFSTQCVPDAKRKVGISASAGAALQPSVVDVASCAKAYGDVVRTWVRTTWVMPIIVQEARSHGCAPNRRKNAAQPRRSYDKDPDLRLPACARLARKEFPDPTVAASWRYRQFVMAYARNLEGADGSWEALKKSTRSFYHDSRVLGCAVLIGGYPIESDADELTTASCQKLLERPDPNELHRCYENARNANKRGEQECQEPQVGSGELDEIDIETLFATKTPDAPPAP